MFRKSVEQEFLPAVLEIQESPPLPAARWILWGILLFFTLAVIWACIGKVDIVAVATGKIVPGGRVKIIQPLETGTVRAIRVREGERVRAGQVLIDLDPTVAGADRESLGEQYLALQLDRARLLSLLAIVNNGNTDTDFFAGLDQATPEQIRLQQQRIQTRLARFRARAASLTEQKNRKRADREAVIQRIAQLDGTIPLVTERANSLKALLPEHLAARVDWLKLEQERIQQVKEREVQRNNRRSLAAAIKDLTEQREALKTAFTGKLLANLTDTENKLKAVEQEQIKADQRVALRQLKAPVAGRVDRLTVHTVGGVVTPAQQLLHIVPDAEAVEVEAWVANRDIGFVHEGQPARIKVETFPFTKYGIIAGTVRTVSSDATPDKQLGLVYETRVTMRKTVMQVEDKIVHLGPGMAVTVEISMGQRRLIEYLLSPLLRYRQESMTER